MKRRRSFSPFPHAADRGTYVAYFQGAIVPLFVPGIGIERYVLAPSKVEDEGRVLQWSFWAANEIEPFVSVLGDERAYKPEPEWDKKALAELAECPHPAAPGIRVYSPVFRSAAIVRHRARAIRSFTKSSFWNSRSTEFMTMTNWFFGST